MRMELKNGGIYEQASQRPHSEHWHQPPLPKADGVLEPGCEDWCPKTSVTIVELEEEATQ